MDKLEASARIVLVLAFLVVAPLLAPVAGHLATVAGLRQVRQERSWRQVKAVLTRSAPQQYDGYGTMASFWVPAKWTAPDGAARSGLVPIRPGTRAGQSARIWVDRSGDATGRRPMTAGLVSVRATLVELAAVICLALAFLTMSGLLRMLLDRRRISCWAMEWACFGPRWTARHWRRGNN